MPEHILMIEDDQRLAAMVSEYLSAAGWRVTTRPTANTGLTALEGHGFDALILDIMLPDLDGFEVCRRARARSDVPILMLTARGEPIDRIVGLELGADDYLPKPFEPRELLARLRAILRRRTGAAVVESPVLRFGNLDAPSRSSTGADRRPGAHAYGLSVRSLVGVGPERWPGHVPRSLDGQAEGSVTRSL